MTGDGDALRQMSSFKQAREAAVHADADDLTHHLRAFAGEVARNPLCARVLAALPQFDAASWWAPYTEGNDAHDALVFPADPDNRLSALWYLVSTMGAADPGGLDFRSFGFTMGAHKRAECAGKAVSIAIRPFAEAMTERLREAVGMANPNLRELGGVPLAAIPSENTTRIFLSHASRDKSLVQPFFDVLEELGYQPWLDARDIVAGSELQRSIANGINTSCAAVFFVTSSFEKAAWISLEIEHATMRKAEQGSRFALISLLYEGGVIPPNLQNFLWVPATSEARSLREIIRALPIRLGLPRWKAEVYQA